MEDIKKNITSRFVKEFKLRDDEIDPYIKDFIMALNENSHINTLYSCEGHHANDDGYVYFQIDEQGWDILFSQVIPELGFKMLRDQNSDEGMHGLKWNFSLCDNAYNAGITIRIDFKTEYRRYTWEEEKEYFWHTLQEVMLKYFPKDTQ